MVSKAVPAAGPGVPSPRVGSREAQQKAALCSGHQIPRDFCRAEEPGYVLEQENCSQFPAEVRSQKSGVW